MYVDENDASLYPVIEEDMPVPEVNEVTSESPFNIKEGTLAHDHGGGE